MASLTTPSTSPFPLNSTFYGFGCSGTCQQTTTIIGSPIYIQSIDDGVVSLCSACYQTNDDFYLPKKQKQYHRCTTLPAAINVVFAAIAKHITSEAFLSSAERSLNGRTGEISENVLTLESARTAAIQMLQVAKPDKQGLLNLKRFQDFFLSAVSMLTSTSDKDSEEAAAVGGSADDAAEKGTGGGGASAAEEVQEIAEYGEFPDVRCALCRQDVKGVLYRHWTLERSLCSCCFQGKTEEKEYHCTAGLREET